MYTLHDLPKSIFNKANPNVDKKFNALSNNRAQSNKTIINGGVTRMGIKLVQRAIEITSV